MKRVVLTNNGLCDMCSGLSLGILKCRGALELQVCFLMTLTGWEWWLPPSQDNPFNLGCYWFGGCLLCGVSLPFPVALLCLTTWRQHLQRTSRSLAGWAHRGTWQYECFLPLLKWFIFSVHLLLSSHLWGGACRVCVSVCVTERKREMDKQVWMRVAIDDDDLTAVVPHTSRTDLKTSLTSSLVSAMTVGTCY